MIEKGDRNISRLLDAGRRAGKRRRVQMIDRISAFLKGAFGMIPLNLPLTNDPALGHGQRGGKLKLPENTVEGCRDRATADLLKAVTMVTANQRRCLERSAETWTLRADLLGRLNKSFEKRDALDRAHKQYEFEKAAGQRSTMGDRICPR